MPHSIDPNRHLDRVLDASSNVLSTLQTMIATTSESALDLAFFSAHTTTSSLVSHTLPPSTHTYKVCFIFRLYSPKRLTDCEATWRRLKLWHANWTSRNGLSPTSSKKFWIFAFIPCVAWHGVFRRVVSRVVWTGANGNRGFSTGQSVFIKPHCQTIGGSMMMTAPISVFRKCCLPTSPTQIPKIQIKWW